MYAVVGTNVCILSEKTKFPVNFFNIFPKSTLNTLGVIFACPLRLFPGAGNRYVEFAKIALPVSGCLQCRHPGPAAGSSIRARDVRNGWFLLSVAGNACCPGSWPPPSGLTITGAARRPAILLRPLSGISCFGCRPVTLHWPLSGISCFGCRRRPIPGAAVPSPAGAPEMYTLKLVLLTYPPLSAFIVSVFLLFLLADGHT